MSIKKMLPKGDSDSSKRTIIKKKKVDWDNPDNEFRCMACGCYLGSIDTSTEAGFDFELVCNNKKCKSNNQKEDKQ